MIVKFQYFKIWTAPKNDWAFAPSRWPCLWSNIEVTDFANLSKQWRLSWRTNINVLNLSVKIWIFYNKKK